MINIQSPCSLLVPSGLFPLLQDTRAKRRRLGLPAAIRPLPSVSSGLEGAGDGGGTANRRAAVNRLASLKPPLCKGYGGGYAFSCPFLVVVAPSPLFPGLVVGVFCSSLAASLLKAILSASSPASHGFLLPLSAARDGRCPFKGIRCVAADGWRRWLLRHVQGWKSLVLLGGRFGSDSGVFHQRRSSERKKKLGTCFGGFDVIFSFVKVLSVQLGDVLYFTLI
ncbi:hypothetical protein PVAP13_5KG444207 [Panicum virgatum]|uniref:Uncharacterized protein n=1 Tax=Panicum virgatum TaxID=38727 RepID=A0A8T0SQP1_PANVG|nr:hypothetical protein PVAP13_5KG444207 [Panicum virgatum]